MLTILWYKNQTLEAKIVQVQKEHKIAEKQLKVEQKRRKSAEQDFRQSKALIDEIRQFKQKMVDDLTTKYKITYEIKYYDVINVEANDILNVREFPGHQNNIVTQIPPTEKCVEFLGDYRLNDSQVWIKVRYQNTQGWVNSFFLMGSGHCDEEEELE
ncbi:hypothetical protein BGP_1206 [Beggiatoa sp. PS]|nr:hypothetical protein BGP_1206 [Beggiatoa sp. PS]